MLLNETAFNALSARADDFEEGRSSHWRHEQNNFKFDQNSFSDVGPMGTFSQAQGLVPTIAHFVLQLPFRLYGLRFRHFISIDKTARTITRRQGRQYDLDMLRHTLTLAFLRAHLELENTTDPICIIGDGYANMSSVIIGSMPQSRAILVNLNKSLIVDLICLRKAFPDLSFALVKSPEELGEALSMDKDCPALGHGANNDCRQYLRRDDVAPAVVLEVLGQCHDSNPPVRCSANRRRRDGSVGHPRRQGKVGWMTLIELVQLCEASSYREYLPVVLNSLFRLGVVSNTLVYRRGMERMLLNETAFNALSARADDFEEGRSSHWRHEQNNFKFDQNSFSDVGPMGTFSQAQGLVPTIAHFVLQLPFRLYGLRFRHFISIDKTARTITRRQGRQYDLDMLRHTLTLAFLRAHLELENTTDPICIIGDGYANMSSVIIGSMPQSRAILVNLNKSLIVDLICLRKAFPDLSFALVKSPEELGEALSMDNLRVIAISANNAGVLEDAGFSLAINIESMMEMDPPVIEEYFRILRSGSKEHSAFYCCNQEHKQFSGDGTSNFFDYPWRDTDEILVDGTCPWTKFRYGNALPFFTRRTPDLHRLIYLSRH